MENKEMREKKIQNSFGNVREETKTKYKGRTKNNNRNIWMNVPSCPFFFLCYLNAILNTWNVYAIMFAWRMCVRLVYVLSIDKLQTFCLNLKFKTADSALLSRWSMITMLTALKHQREGEMTFCLNVKFKLFHISVSVIINSVFLIRMLHIIVSRWRFRCCIIECETIEDALPVTIRT